MLSTEELKNYVYDQIQNRLGEMSCSNLFFTVGNENSIEGSYIFSQNNVYHIVFVEKGKIRSDVETYEKRDVLWHALNIISRDIILGYAIKNKRKGKDFRRSLFEKEIEIFSLFGNDFEIRKKLEIGEILEKYPYCDN